MEIRRKTLVRIYYQAKTCYQSEYCTGKEVLKRGDSVSDLRQSRRLEGGGAARGRWALRAMVRRLSPVHRAWVLVQPLQIPPASYLLFMRPLGSATIAAATPFATIDTGSTLKPPQSFPSTHTPATVKLWESPRQSRGFTQ